MKWEMEILSSAPCTPNSNSDSDWFVEDNRSSKWTRTENKLFENALAVHDKDTPDRWHKVAEMIPGKTVRDVMRQYKDLEVDVSNIEAGLIPVPGYSTTTSPFTLDWVNTPGYDGFKGSGKRSSSVRPPEQERKKGVPWTEEEHKLFLLGLKKYGKGDWRNISRNFVITRTPTQVASHAQKYFIRQLSGGKDKRRASIHDITTVNLTETITTSSEDTNRSTSPQHSMMQQNSTATTPRTHFQWNNQPNAEGAMPLNPAYEKVFMSPYGVNSFGLKMQGQNLHKGVHESSYLGPQTHNMVFQMQQSSQHYSHA
ncbi:transcription factor DIVARICATA-like [Gastrolobium bilobum]|uniref:transcription factor DIVARICATA-like n=1 Tax=Gastrolobium bilobum TaxID=150636 RepID=UPI002AAF48AB|nr:transcription factor DIVARICATA-like [Gastrolobium bilobum]XP_061347143.1 transcription factor DIVARICATA-like [Gastrolobium bilobum]